MQKVHGIRIGTISEGPLCICGEWACDKALGLPSRRLLTWVGAVALYLAGLMLVVGVCVLLWSMDDTSAAPGLPVVTPAPYPGPPATTGQR